MKKIAILGGNGFIGKNLIKLLCMNDKYTVTSFDHKTVEKKWRLSNINYVTGDFFNCDDIEKIVLDNDILVHAICTINPGTSNDTYMYAYQNDFIQSIFLCEMCVKYKKRLLFISSGGAIYGKQKSLPIPEDAKIQPLNHYGNLKYCTENAYRIFTIQQKADIIIVRISNVFGPGQDYSKGVGFIDAVIKRGFTGKVINVYGNGNIVRDYLYIDDGCKMLLSLLDYHGDFNTFNISSCSGITQNRIIQIVSKHIPDLRIKYTLSRSVDVNKVILDNSRIKQVYKGKIYTVEEGIEKYIEYIKNTNHYKN